MLDNLIKIKDRIERREMIRKLTRIAEERNGVRMRYSMTSSMSIVSMRKSESEKSNKIVALDVMNITTTTSSSVLDENIDKITIVGSSEIKGNSDREGERDADVIIGRNEM